MSKSLNNNDDDKQKCCYNNDIEQIKKEDTSFIIEPLPMDIVYEEWENNFWISMVR